MSIQISEKDAQELGFQSIVQVGSDLGFTDFQKTSVTQLKNAYLDLENLGALKRANPKLVIRKPIDFTKTESCESKVWQSWRQVAEQEHYFAKYQVSTTLVGQLSDIHIPASYYNYTSNNFFKPFKETKAVKRLQKQNDFSYARFRYPKYASNTLDLTVETTSGVQNLRPKFAGFLSKEENRKTYYRWHQSATRFSSGENVQKYVYNPNGGEINFQGFSIPYPNTLSVYEGIAFNIPTKISTKFNSDNSQTLNGLLVISTGDAEQKTICYVSPHTIKTGHLNTLEDIYTESSRKIKTTSPGSNILATVENASWYGSTGQGYLGCYSSGYIDNLNGDYRECSIPSSNNTHKRFYKLGETTKQIYFDHTLPTQYGSGRWCMALSGNTNININTGHNAVIYMHNPNSFIDWKKTDPRTLSGPWTVASGHPKAANSTYLNRANIKKPTISSYKLCRKTRIVNTEKLQVPSLIIDSKYISGGNVLPKGIKSINHIYTGSAYPKWRLVAGPEGPDYSGYVINDTAVTMTQIMSSGISIPQAVYNGMKYSIDNNEHFKQDIPLKDTYFYKFYNQLYKQNNKSIATGTWNGIIPSGVKVSVELISTTLNSQAGINGHNLAIVYSGYGNGDKIDKALQTGVSKDGAHTIFPNPSAQYAISGKVAWIQNRYPYRHAFNEFGQLAYTAFRSGPTATDAVNIAKVFAIKTINSKILQLVNKILPNATYKNKKWKRLQTFKSKLPSIKSAFSRLTIPDSALPGAEIKRRLSPYSEN